MNAPHLSSLLFVASATLAIGALAISGCSDNASTGGDASPMSDSAASDSSADSAQDSSSDSTQPVADSGHDSPAEGAPESASDVVADVRRDSAADSAVDAPVDALVNVDATNLFDASDAASGDSSDARVE